MSSETSVCEIKDSAFILEDLALFYQGLADVDVFINAAGNVEILAINALSGVVDRVMVWQLRSTKDRFVLHFQ